jgi:hypothetical protein
LDTFSGQLALQLAERIADRSESGISALSKELRTVMTEALDGVTPEQGGDEAAEPEPDVEDEVERARRRRDEKARLAGGGA